MSGQKNVKMPFRKNNYVDNDPKYQIHDYKKIQISKIKLKWIFFQNNWNGKLSILQNNYNYNIDRSWSN